MIFITNPLPLQLFGEQLSNVILRLKAIKLLVTVRAYNKNLPVQCNR